MRPVEFIVVHHTASPETTSVEDVRRWHVVENGWSDIGYHFLIHREAGEWVTSKCRPLDRVGAHDKGANRLSVGIAVAGHYDKTPLSDDARNQLANLIIDLCRRYMLSVSDVYGHSEKAPSETGTDKTECPGFDMGVLRAGIVAIQSIRSAVESGVWCMASTIEGAS